MNTTTAQRRLLEALATLRNTPGLDCGQQDNALAAAVIGFRFLADSQAPLGPEGAAVARVQHALADLAEAVDEEMRAGASRG